MKMKWNKKGIILNSTTAIAHGYSNTQVPYAFVLNDLIRIFFGARKHGSMSASIFYIDVDINEPHRILNFSEMPILSNGKIGCFDEDGVLPVCLKRVDKYIYLYYGGFSRAVSHPHFCMMGLAISKDNGNTFERFSDGPILSISKTDPYLIGSADIIFEDAIFHMIYTSGIQWENINDNLELCYSLKYACSVNAIDWKTTEDYLISNDNNRYALAKPSIFKIDKDFYMMYSKRELTNYRKKGESSYKLQLAKSNNLKEWNNVNDIENITPSKNGWDSDMVCYPNVINILGRHIMFYNGNGFGESGFGYAELEGEL